MLSQYYTRTLSYLMVSKKCLSTGLHAVIIILVLTICACSWFCWRHRMSSPVANALASCFSFSFLFLKFSSAHLCIYGIPSLFVSFFSSNSLATVIIFYIFISSCCSSLDSEPPSYAFEFKNSGIYWRKIRWWHLQTDNDAFIPIWIWNRLLIRAYEWHLLLHLVILLVNVPKLSFHTEC